MAKEVSADVISAHSTHSFRFDTEMLIRTSDYDVELRFIFMYCKTAKYHVISVAKSHDLQF
jgi:hypothetical protein